jgi:hypothetical protein
MKMFECINCGRETSNKEFCKECNRSVRKWNKVSEDEELKIYHAGIWTADACDRRDIDHAENDFDDVMDDLVCESIGVELGLE